MQTENLYARLPLCSIRMLRQAIGRLAVSAAPRQVVTSFCRPLSTTTSEPRKTKAQLRREEYLKGKGPEHGLPDASAEGTSMLISNPIV